MEPQRAAPLAEPVREQLAPLAEPVLVLVPLLALVLLPLEEEESAQQLELRRQ